MDRDTAAYIFRYYDHFMTLEEQLANRHLMGTMKLTHGQSDLAAQSKATLRAKNEARRELFSDNPEILEMATEGFEAFQMRVAERIFEKHRHEIFFNYCPKCGKLAKTPKAKQCRFCSNDWHTISI